MLYMMDGALGNTESNGLTFKWHFKLEVIHMGFVLGVIVGACTGFLVTALITANR